MKKLAFAIMAIATTSIYSQLENNYEIKNLDFNTKNSDFGVTPYKDNTLIFSQAKHNPKKGSSFLNLYVVSEDEKVEKRKKKNIRFSKANRSPFHESNVVFTKDYKTVYFTRTNHNAKRGKRDAHGYVVLKLYKAENVNGKWKNIQELPFSSNNYSVGHPTLSTDEKKLYFTSDMPGNYGGTDIFYVDILGDNTYSTPKNLGPKINTKGKEMFPFIDENNTLYFSSTQHNGNKGGLDIFSSKLENNTFQTPQNLGVPINSDADDFCFIKRIGQKNGYFSSNRYGGKGDDDIYAFTLLTTGVESLNK